MDNNVYNMLVNLSNNSVNSTPTHISNYGPKKEWCIEDNNYTEFINNYCKYIKENKNGKYCISEVIKSYSPIILVFNFKYYITALNNKNIFNNTFIPMLIKNIQDTIKELFNIQNDDDLTVCVLTKNNYIKDNILNIDIRLQFVNCKVKKDLLKSLIIPHLIQKFKNINIFSKLSSQPINDWCDIIISDTNNCLMYGSSEDINIPKFNLKYIFNYINNIVDIDNIPSLPFNTVFDINKHMYIINNIINHNIFQENQDLNYWLPLFLSINYNNNICHIKQIYDQNNNNNKNQNIDCNSDEYLCDVFINMLKPSRFNNKVYWIDIGKSIFNIFNGNDNGLNKWIQITALSNNFNKDDCYDFYPTFRQKNYNTIKTLAWFAKYDSPKNYNLWHIKHCHPFIQKATSLTHSDVADAFYHIYWLEFATSSLNKNSVYYFKNNIWTKSNTGIDIRMFITNKFIKVFEKERVLIDEQILSSNDDNLKNAKEEITKNLGKLINKLKNRTFKNHIVEECLEKFFIQDFESILDSDIDILGLSNGVIQITDDDAFVRPGKPEDYVSRTSSLIYPHNHSWQHKNMKILLDWFSKVFPNKELLHYFGKFCGSCLKGGNSDKLFPVFTGSGDNSKSMIKKLFEASFGSYCVTIPTQVLTSTSRGSGPSPELARTKGARIVFAPEPSSDVSIKNGNLKLFCGGGDKFFARSCNENGGEIDINFITILMCNQIPIVPNSDKAVKNRMRVLPFMSTWVKDADPDINVQFEKLEFQMDPFFERKIPHLAPSFMWYCTRMYKIYRKEGLRSPDIIKQHTLEYWKNNDIYMLFKEQFITKATIVDINSGKNITDVNSVISLNNIYSLFKDWHREQFNNLKCPDRNVAKCEFEQRLGKSINNKWRGYKIKMDENMYPDI